jgi:hypothetical protein
MFRKQILLKIIIIAASSAAVLILLTACPQPGETSPVTDGTVKGYQKISATKGGFDGALDNGDSFGIDVSSVGDLDGDGVSDIAVGAFLDDDGADSNRGAVWVLFLQTDGTVKGRQKISSEKGDFTGVLENSDKFGYSLISPGDIDGDGINDLAVGAPDDDDGGADSDRGAVWVLFLNTDGTVKDYQKISDTEGSFDGTLADNDNLGSAVAPLGDLDGDGIPDIAVGAMEAEGGGSNRGAVWILFLNTDGTVKTEQKISDDGSGGFSGTLDDEDRFGYTLASAGDIDGDGNTDLTVGAFLDGDGGDDRGAVWILFLRTDGTVGSHQKISSTAGNFGGTITDYDAFGSSIVSPGDLDGNGTPDLVVGSLYDDDGGTGIGANRGAVWVLFLNDDGTVAGEQKISDIEGTFGGTLNDSDVFGSSAAFPGDLDGDGIADLVIGAEGDDDGVTDAGAVWVLFLAEAETE